MATACEQRLRKFPQTYDLFRKNGVSDCVESGFLEYYYSKNLLSTGKLEFVVEGNSDHMIIPSKTYLRLKVELGGSARRVINNETREVTLAEGARVGVVNNILHSMFESVEVYLSNQALTKTDRHNPYVAYIQTLLNNSQESLETYFQLSGWAPDTAGEMDTFVSGENNGYEMRKTYLKDNKMELIGKLHHPLFFQEKALPTQVTMSVLLKKGNEKFFLMHETGEFELKIVEAVLMVQKVHTVPSIQKAYLSCLEEGHSIPYFLKSAYVNFMTIEQGSSQFMRDNLFLGKLPRRVILGLVETEAYQGKENRNPFNFQHFGLTDICLYKDGIPFPRPPIKLDIEEGVCAEAYHHFMTSLSAAYTRFIPAAMTMSQYSKGYTLFSFDMSPDQLGSTHPGSLHNTNSNVRLEMKFKNPLKKNVTLLVYSEEECLMEIHKDRRVTIDI